MAAANARARALSPERARIEGGAGAAPLAPSFLGALDQTNVAVIAELKRASPSKGGINPSLDVSSQCKAYEDGGAAAVSVLTEPTRFGGSLEDLIQARKACSRPLLRKDFIVDPLQVSEARGAGASAVLLIVRALDPSCLLELFRAVVESKLYALVEVRDEAELDTALSIGATIIGVNNRNLETLEMDDAAASIIPLIPRKCIAVAESGYRTMADVERAARAGADAVLVGAELSASADPARLVAELASINRPRHARPN